MFYQNTSFAGRTRLFGELRPQGIGCLQGLMEKTQAKQVSLMLETIS